MTRKDRYEKAVIFNLSSIVDDIDELVKHGVRFLNVDDPTINPTIVQKFTSVGIRIVDMQIKGVVG